MRAICAWCGKDMGPREPAEDKSLTHGICPDCSKAMTQDLYTHFTELLRILSPAFFAPIDSKTVTRIGAGSESD